MPCDAPIMKRLGAWLLNSWNMPDHLCQAVLHSHDLSAAGVDADQQVGDVDDTELRSRWASHAARTAVVAVGGKVFVPEGKYNYDGKKVVNQLEMEGLLVAGNRFATDEGGDASAGAWFDLGDDAANSTATDLADWLVRTLGLPLMLVSFSLGLAIPRITHDCS